MTSISSAFTAAVSALPPDVYDTTTLVSLASTLAILAAAYGASRLALPSGAGAATVPTSTRILFIWHAFDALIHFVLEGSFLYHCFFSWAPAATLVGDASVDAYPFYPTRPHPFLGHADRLYGVQAAATAAAEGGGAAAAAAAADGLVARLAQPLAQLWLVYARADRRWAGADVGVISLELLTVLVVGPLAVWTCVELARGATPTRAGRLNARACVLMTVIATAELYGGFMTFCPEWLTANANLDTSNAMYLWVYLFFFNTLWVWVPAYALWVAAAAVGRAFAAQDAQAQAKKGQ